MEIATKYSVGQEVCLFNAISQQIEHDEVYAVLVAPNPVPGKNPDPNIPVSKSLEAGTVEVGYRYQLQRHQGLLEEKILFASEEELKEYYLDLFKA